jgi:4-hydroxybutyryl-CoA dehydratase/vinylacetyl-CoA-Delta-isomerase
MKREIWRQYLLEDKVALIEDLLERSMAGDIVRPRARQPGRCCITGCQVPELPLTATQTSEAAE